MPQSFIIHSSYLLTILNDNWPPDSVLSKGTTRSVRSSVNKKKKDGTKVDTLFFGISVPIHNGGLHQDGSALRLVGGKEVVASSSGGRQARKQASK